MRKNTAKLLVLVGANAVLLMLILVHVALAASRMGSSSTLLDLYPQNSAVSRIRLQGPQSIELVRSGQNWLVERDGQIFPGDASRVEAFLEALRAVRRVERVAASKKSWDNLGLADAETIAVTLLGENGSVISDFLVGSFAAGTNMVYLAQSGSESAWRVPAGFASYARGSSHLWYDLRLFQGLVPAQAQTLELRGRLQYPDGVAVQADYRLQRSQSGWIHPGRPDLLLDTAKVEAMLRAWAGARGQSFVTGTSKDFVADADLSVFLSDGTSLTLRLADGSEEGSFLAELDPSGKRLLVASWAVRESFKALEDLLAP